MLVLLLFACEPDGARKVDTGGEDGPTSPVEDSHSADTDGGDTRGDSLDSPADSWKPPEDGWVPPVDTGPPDLLVTVAYQRVSDGDRCSIDSTHSGYAIAPLCPECAYSFNLHRTSRTEVGSACWTGDEEQALAYEEFQYLTYSYDYEAAYHYYSAWGEEYWGRYPEADAELIGWHGEASPDRHAWWIFDHEEGDTGTTFTRDGPAFVWSKRGTMTSTESLGWIHWEDCGGFTSTDPTYGGRAGTTVEGTSSCVLPPLSDVYTMEVEAGSEIHAGSEGTGSESAELGLAIVDPDGCIQGWGYASSGCPSGERYTCSDITLTAATGGAWTLVSFTTNSYVGGCTESNERDYALWAEVDGSPVDLTLTETGSETYDLVEHTTTMSWLVTATVP